MNKYTVLFFLAYLSGNFVYTEELPIIKQIEIISTKIKKNPEKKKYLQLNLVALFLKNKQYPEAFLVLTELKKQKMHTLQDYIVFYWGKAHYEMGLQLLDNKKYKESTPVFKKGRETFLSLYDAFPDSILLGKLNESIGLVDKAIADALFLRKLYKPAHLKYSDALSRINSNELLKEIRVKMLEVHEKLSEWKKTFKIN